MYSELIEVADRTLAQNQRVRAHADELRVRTNTLILTYRVHRFRPISGASDAGEDDRVRRLLRECFAGTQKPKSYVGYSRGSVCQACGGVNGLGAAHMVHPDPVFGEEGLEAPTRAVQEFEQVT